MNDTDVRGPGSLLYVSVASGSKIFYLLFFEFLIPIYTYGADVISLPKTAIYKNDSTELMG